MAAIDPQVLSNFAFIKMALQILRLRLQHGLPQDVVNRQARKPREERVPIGGSCPRRPQRQHGKLAMLPCDERLDVARAAALLVFDGKSEGARGKPWSANALSTKGACARLLIN